MATTNFTTTSLDFDSLVSAYDAALASTNDPRWRNAIKAAFSWLSEQRTVQHDAHGSLLVPSTSTPGLVHFANGSCNDCPAHANGQPCVHRAAARLVRRALERKAARQRTQAAQLLVNQIAAQRAKVLAELAECY